MSELVNHLWQSTLFALAAGMVVLALRNHGGRVRYWIWLAASLKFLVPFSLLVSAGRQIETPVVMTAAVAERVGSTFLVMNVPPQGSSATFDFAALAIAVWLLGALVVAFRWVQGWRLLREALRAGRPVAGVAQTIAVVETPHAIEPGVFGLWNPVLLLPAGLTGRLNREEMDAIVAHELCHVRHRDNLTAALHMVVQTVVWFHPLVWWIGHRLIDERERACDEAVVSRGLAPDAYVRGILTVCRYCIESPVACAAGVTGSDLKKRVEGIMKSAMSRRLSLGAKAVLATVALAAILAPVFVGSAARAQTAAATASNDTFEVASVKPGDPSVDRIALQFTPGGGVRLVNASLKQMIMLAYGVQPAQVTGGPGWIDSDRFVVEAKGPETAGGPRTPAEERASTQRRLQALLKDRFGLAVRTETKEMPGFALLVAKGGVKMTESASAAGPQGGRQGMRLAGRGEVSGQGASPAMLADILARTLGRKVVDRTGLTKTYDFTLKWSPQPGEGGGGPRGGPGGPSSAAESSGPTIFTAVQEQLGLRLESQKVESDLIVVERAEKPSEN